jgi:hypothetical protein
MASFNLADYETVEQRHARVIEQYPDLRCIMVNHTTPADRAVGMWVVEARVYLNAADQAADLPKATEWAFEIDGVGMANKTSALENACTSSLGRSLRWAVGGSKGASREEMAKVAGGKTPAKRDWLGEADKLALTYDVDGLRLLYTDAVAAGARAEILEKIKAYGSEVAKP